MRVRKGGKLDEIKGEQASAKGIVPMPTHKQNPPTRARDQAICYIGNLASVHNIREKSPWNDFTNSKPLDIFPNTAAIRIWICANHRDSGRNIAFGSVVREFGVVGTNIGVAIVDIDTINEIPDISPWVFDVPVLNRCISISTYRPPCMICHYICAAVIDGGSMPCIGISFPNFGLAVPVGKLHKIEQPYGTPSGIIILAPFAPFTGGANPEIVTGDTSEGGSTTLGNMTFASIVAAQIIPGAGMFFKPWRSSVCNVIVNPVIGRIVNDVNVK